MKDHEHQVMDDDRRRPVDIESEAERVVGIDIILASMEEMEGADRESAEHDQRASRYPGELPAASSTATPDRSGVRYGIRAVVPGDEVVHTL
jgi:hypothetical protein